MNFCFQDTTTRWHCLTNKAAPFYISFSTEDHRSASWTFLHLCVCIITLIVSFQIMQTRLLINFDICIYMHFSRKPFHIQGTILSLVNTPPPLFYQLIYLPWLGPTSIFDFQTKTPSVFQLIAGGSLIYKTVMSSSA